MNEQEKAGDASPPRASRHLDAPVGGQVSSEEVTTMLRRVGRGELVPVLVDVSRSWREVFAGNVDYRVGDWLVTIFNDCGDWDYVDSVVAPGGRVGEFEDWAGTVENDYQGNQPDDALYMESIDLYDRMVTAFIKATANRKDKPRDE